MGLHHAVQQPLQCASCNICASCSPSAHTPTPAELFSKVRLSICLFVPAMLHSPSISVLAVEAICKTIQTDLQEMTENNDIIKDYIAPITRTSFAKRDLQKGSDSGNQFLKSTGHQSDSFATPDSSLDYK